MSVPSGSSLFLTPPPGCLWNPGWMKYLPLVHLKVHKKVFEMLSRIFDVWEEGEREKLLGLCVRLAYQQPCESSLS